MSDFNDSLASANQSLGTNFADIKGGGAGGFGVRMWPTEQILLRLDFEGLLAQTEDSGVTFDIGPGAATLSGTYFFPSQSPVRFGLGAGLGTYSIAGELKGPGGKFNTAGSGFGFHGMGEAVLPFSGRWSLSGILGYRYAKVDDVKVNDQSTNTEADFSGVMVRVGLAYDWKPKH
ncbi:MAG: hypothetical protein HYR73_00585 [Candidatus Eisenbacteria bacterium]|nr:hypothetical protein [Candidatus Eisenbacteria bacterium]